MWQKTAQKEVSGSKLKVQKFITEETHSSGWQLRQPLFSPHPFTQTRDLSVYLPIQSTVQSGNYGGGKESSFNQLDCFLSKSQ